MYDSYVIEIDETEAGLLLRQGAAFVFHAVADRFHRFEGVIFPDPWSAERALRGNRSTRRTAGLSRGRRAG